MWQQGNAQIRTDMRKWKAMKVNKITADLQVKRLLKSDIKHPSQPGLLPIAHTAFSTSHATSDEFCLLFLFRTLPTEVQA